MTTYIFSDHGLCRQASSCCRPSCRRIKYLQSGIGVRAIRRTARIAPANAATPTTASIFLLGRLFVALQISAAQVTQTAAAASAMPNISHNQDSSYKILMCSSPSLLFIAKPLLFLNLFVFRRTAHRRFRVPYPCTGSSTAIVVPFFELSSTRTQPPWRLAISHTKESPSPTPPYSRLRDLSTRKKG